LTESGEAREVGFAVGRIHVGELPEEALEAGRRDDLDDLAGHIAGVPERVPLVPRLEDPGSGFGGQDVVAEQRTERSGQNIGELSLAAVAMRGRSGRALR